MSSAQKYEYLIWFVEKNEKFQVEVHKKPNLSVFVAVVEK